MCAEFGLFLLFTAAVLYSTLTYDSHQTDQEFLSARNASISFTTVMRCRLCERHRYFVAKVMRSLKAEVESCGHVVNTTGTIDGQKKLSFLPDTPSLLNVSSNEIALKGNIQRKRFPVSRLFPSGLVPLGDVIGPIGKDLLRFPVREGFVWACKSVDIFPVSR